MPLPFRIARAVVGVTPETTPGTFVEPPAADSFFAQNITVTPSMEAFERRETFSHFGLRDFVPGVATMEISFEIPLVGAAASGTAPYYANALRGAGHTQTIISGTSVTYKPANLFNAAGDNPSESYSAAVWEEGGGPRYALAGGIGNLSFSAKTGEPIILRFVFRGVYVATVDDSTPPAVTASALTPPTFVSAALSVHGTTALLIESMEFDKGNDIQIRADVNQASGLRTALVAAHKPTIKINPEMVTVASHDFFGRWRGGTTGAIQTGVIGSPAGNRVQFIAGRTQYRELGLAERASGRILDITANISVAAGAATGDDYSIQFT